MASGSQTYSGICADLPTAPTKSSRAIGVNVGGVPDRVGLDEGEHAGEVNGAEDLEGEEDRQEEAEVADAVDDERLLPCRGAPVLLEVEADQQVAAQPDALPADEQDDQVGPEDERQHGEHEQVQVGEVPRIRALALAVHVPHRVDVDQEPHERHEEQHHRRQRIQPQREVDREVREQAVGGLAEPGGDPGEHAVDVDGVRPDRQSPVADRREAGEHREPGAGQRHPRRRAVAPGAPVADQAVHRGAEQREERDEPEQILHAFPLIPASR